MALPTGAELFSLIKNQINTVAVTTNIEHWSNGIIYLYESFVPKPHKFTPQRPVKPSSGRQHYWDALVTAGAFYDTLFGNNLSNIRPIRAKACIPYANMKNLSKKCYWNEIADLHGIQIVAPNNICDVYTF